jgi:NAD(P)-dependent dehydrogenase (short-subunit alcohol dehydrogenase family)
MQRIALGRYWAGFVLAKMPSPTRFRSRPQRTTVSQKGDKAMEALTDRVAIVTGGNSGIGRAIALAYAKEGAKLILAARRGDKLAEVVDEIRAAGGTALPVQTDITQEKDVLALFEAAMAAHGRVHILINNAGTATREAADELPLAQWQKVIDVNLTGAFLCAREAFKIMKRQGSGRIINIGSVSAKVPRPNTIAYAASKFGLEGMTRALALEGREHGILVSILHPGNTVSSLGPAPRIGANPEGRMEAEDLAQVAVLMAKLPSEVNMLEALVLPRTMPFLGRG